MSKRTIVILSVIYLILVTGLYWVAFQQPAGAVSVSVEVVQPSPIIATFTDDIPTALSPQATYNPQGR